MFAGSRQTTTKLDTLSKRKILIRSVILFKRVFFVHGLLSTGCLQGAANPSQHCFRIRYIFSSTAAVRLPTSARGFKARGCKSWLHTDTQTDRHTDGQGCHYSIDTRCYPWLRHAQKQECVRACVTTTKHRERQFALPTPKRILEQVCDWPTNQSWIVEPLKS